MGKILNLELTGQPSDETSLAPDHDLAEELSTPLGLELMPKIFRLTSIQQTVFDARHTDCTATLFHNKAQLKVKWHARHPDHRLKPNLLVSPRWTGKPNCQGGAITISRLVPMERPEPEENLFETIPSGWVRDGELLQQAAKLIAILPNSYKCLFNAIFWDGDRFRRFCKAPASMSGHHQEDGGNLRHAIDVALMMQGLCRIRKNTNLPLGIMSALLHDAGKADEYRLGKDGQRILTDRGRLLGHQVTVIEWIASAMARWNLRLPEEHYMALLHCLTCSANAPDYLGIRKPAMLEAFMLSDADRNSGHDDLFTRCSAGVSGWGTYHKHLKNRPYTLSPLATEPSCESIEQEGTHPFPSGGVF